MHIPCPYLAAHARFVRRPRAAPAWILPLSSGAHRFSVPWKQAAGRRELLDAIDTRGKRMQDLSLNSITSDAQALANYLGTQTTEALIRAVSGVQQTAREGVAAVRDGAESAGSQISQVGQELAGGIQTVVVPKMSARMAWRAGRTVGRIEGAVRLAAFGARFWWRRRQRERQRHHPTESTEWLRVLVQWGPTTVASAYLATQVWTRVRWGPPS